MDYLQLLEENNKNNPAAFYLTEAFSELVKEEEEYLIKMFRSVGINPNIILEQEAKMNTMKAQLNAVLEIHVEDNGYCLHCRNLCHSYTGLSCDDEGDGKWPCSTIRAIEKLQ